MQTDLSPTGEKYPALGRPTSGNGGGGGGGGGEAEAVLFKLFVQIGGLAVNKIRKFERFINSLPMNYIVGILLGILVAAWAIYKTAGGG